MSLSLGLVFSTTGSYAALGQSALAGALAAIDKVNAQVPGQITPVIADPGGEIADYERLTRELLQGGVRHILGSITSWSRKEIIPLVEQYGGLLWYPCPFEGFESNDHVVYLGAAPNHHVLPVIDWIAARGVQRVFLLGSNYVWGWETLRLARECLGSHGVEVIGERYVPLGSDCPEHVVEEICSNDIDCVVDSLIGPSNESFLRKLAQCDPDRAAIRGHVVSFNQTEADLDRLGASANGLLAAGSFFEEDAGEELRAAARARTPNGRVSSFMATSYAAVEIIAEATKRAKGTEPGAVFQAATLAPTETAMGPIAIDPVLRHAELRPQLAVAEDGLLKVIDRAEASIPADPYLAGRRVPAMRRQPHLRVVS